ncbi:hypothetical protein [Halopseudomonas bauzanensis]|uniref:hypothetical protein n=1 Tax=Halopseudomonas bauzanensis TaxID=653930 RepID=UPI0025564996|nr:hypothetical protein [Halopseudomonas bauzanensis]
MTPEQRSAVRAGCNLAALPADVRAEIEEEKRRCGEQHQEVQRKAAQLYGMRSNRLWVERELAQLGEIGPAVRAVLNKLISGGSKRGNGN